MDNDSQSIIEMIASSKTTQADVSARYAVLIRRMATNRDEAFDWPAINQAIIKRWPKGLLRIKDRAWKIAEGR